MLRPLVSAIALVACVAIASGSRASERGRPYRASHYDVALRVDPADKSIRGEVTITIAARGELGAVDLDCGELTIDSVSDGGHTLSFTKSPDLLHIELPRAWHARQTHRLRIAYHGQPRAGLRFFARGWYTAFTTQGWLPCDADPADKATLALAVDAPADLRLYATGTRGGTQALPGAYQHSTWTLGQPYSTYLFGMVAGPFVEQCQPSHGVSVCAAATAEHAKDLPRILTIATAALDFFSARAGVPYPYEAPRYDQVFVPGDVAQELAGMALLGDDYFTALAEDPHEDWAVLHELSHQWWGNSVTARSWTDFWLHEGMAIFMVAAAKEQRWGRADYDDELALARRRYVRALAKAPRAIAWDGWTRPGDMGGAITYSGGALVLATLRRQLGDAAFWDGLRRFTRAGRGGTVTSDDLRRALEAASGRPLQRFFETWVYNLPPELTAETQKDAGRVTVEIAQTHGTPLSQPLAIAVETARGRQVQTVTLVEGHGAVTFTGADAPILSLRIDDGATLPIVVRYARPVKMLLHQLAHEPDLAGRFEAAAQLEQLCGRAASPRDRECEALPAAVHERAPSEPSRLLRAFEQQLAAPQQHP